MDSVNSLPAFVLYWILFVGDSEKAANIIFRRFCEKEADWRPDADQKLIRHFEDQGVSRRLPDLCLLDTVCREIVGGTHLLPNRGERFSVLDANKDQSFGDALRFLSTNHELIRCALLWVQRDYISGQFPDYDPTSSRDEDLPLDLDHLVPHAKFGADWRRQQNLLSFVNEKENFRYLRGLVGNSLGNYRWLDASVNRGRQDGIIDEADCTRDFINDVLRWNTLIDKQAWSEEDVALFQQLIDLRSVAIYKCLLEDGGLQKFVTATEHLQENLKE